MVEEAGDMVSVLIRDHEEVKDLFRRIESTDDVTSRRKLADLVTAELVRHSVAEEMYLYPAARDALPDGDRKADEEIQEHAEVEELLKRWERLDADDPEFTAVFEEMRRSVLHHIDQEEGQLFPELQRNLTVPQMDALGEKISKAKRLAPTRPHPAAPDEPPLDKLLGLPIGLVDRIRDMMSRRET
jgi:hemerythrin superfamily protein